MPFVPRDGRLKFFGPELGPRRRSRCEPATLVTMPETPVNEYDGSISRENEIGAPGKAPVMKPKAKALCMHGLAQQEFRLRILAADIGHHP